MSEEVAPAQIEANMRNVVTEENYSIARTYQNRKKNYIINCDFIQDVSKERKDVSKLYF